MEQRLRSGPFLMILASAAFTSMVACVRIARQELGGIEVVFWRAAISVPLLLLVLRGSRLRLSHGRVFAVRAVLGFAAMACFYTAARETDLVTLSLITRLQPILVTLFAPLILGRGERSGSAVVVAAVVGFAGSALLTVPDLRAGSWSVLWAVAATFFSAGAHLALRRVAVDDSGRAIVFWFHGAMLPLALVSLLGSGGTLHRPPEHLWWLLLAIGAFATLGQLLITRAYKVERAPVVAAASYSGVLWALLFDLLIFDQIPSLWAVGGGLLVLGSSLWLVLGPTHRRPATMP